MPRAFFRSRGQIRGILGPFVAVHMLPRWRSRVLWIRGWNGGGVIPFSRTILFPSHFLFAWHSTSSFSSSRRDYLAFWKIARDICTWVCEFFDSPIATLRGMTGRELFAWPLVKARHRRSERLDARIAANKRDRWKKQRNIYRWHESIGFRSWFSRPRVERNEPTFQTFYTARNAGNQWCNPASLSLSLSRPRTADSIAENWRGWVARMIENAYNADLRNFVAVNWQLWKTSPFTIHANDFFSRTRLASAHAREERKIETMGRNSGKRSVSRIN